MKFRPHESFTALAKEAEPQSAYRVLEGQARQFAGRFGFDIEEGESVWDSFPPPFTDELTLYEAVRGFSDHDLEQLADLADRACRSGRRVASGWTRATACSTAWRGI